MATAIHELNLDEPLRPITGLAAYAHCMLILRSGGEVVGREFVSTNGQDLDLAQLRAVVLRAMDGDGRNSWVARQAGYDPRRVDAWQPPATTVAVCTRDRPEDLARALTAIARLDPPPAEVLVIDNAPASDATRVVVATHAASHAHVRYVREAAGGLDRARNRALREARTPIVAFTDDDAVPEAAWLARLAANFGDPRVLCATGLTLPLELDTPAQELFEEHCPFERGFARRIFDGQCDHPLAISQAGAGANMAVRREAVLALGGFDERLDGGTPSRSGGDHDLFTRILAHGARVVYDPAAVSWHRHRRTLSAVTDTVSGYGTGVYAMWTRLLLEQRELGVLRMAWGWLRHTQLPLAFGRRPVSRERVALSRAELRGCLRGPRAWFAAVREQEAGG